MGDSERGRGFLGGAKSLSLGSSPVAGDAVAAGLGLIGLDNAVFLLEVLEINILLIPRL